MSDRFAGVVIVAAGRGERFGHGGKVLAPAGGRPLLAWCLDAAMHATTASEIVVVGGSHTRDGIAQLIDAMPGEPLVRHCVGGAQRQDSVRAGIDALSAGIEVAIIHDAARPLANPAMFDDVARAARTGDAAITAIAVTDTIKEVDGARVVRTVPRQHLRAAQTPQAFRLDVLRRAMDAAAVAGETFTDEGGLLEWAGVPVVVRPGSPSNIKVTVPDDLLIADALLRARDTDGGVHVST